MIFALLASVALAAFPDSFPATWVGRWEGRCKIPTTLVMGLRIAPIAGTTKHTWEVTYKQDGTPPQVRAYELLTVDAARGHYAVDEKNGIVIDSYFTHDILRSLFSVSSRVIAFRYALEGGKIHAEGPAYGVRPTRVTRAGSFEVAAFPLEGDQLCVLERAP